MNSPCGTIRFLILLILYIPISSACGLVFLPGMQDSHKGLTCNSCHKGQASVENPQLKESDNPSNLCKNCHKYFNPEDHHPSKIRFGTAKVGPYFSLHKGEMVCLTCHQAHAGSNYRRSTKKLLKGGPYRNRRGICFQCHSKSTYKGINPHDSMLGEDNKLNYNTCRLCHANPPDPAVDRAKDVRFKAAVHFLCWRCHPPMNSDFFDIHFLKKQRYKPIEIDTWQGATRADTFDNMKEREAAADYILPLDRSDRLTCSTCHNPHQPGVLIDKKAAKGTKSNKRLRLTETGICDDCHEDN